ncbi:MAG: transcriptional repressor [Clostridiales bacterium]|uniref:Fur family transcriptional regulator n=1 Tax=Clostridium sp. N3C TaxID=1776758 RepID=UPI00092DEFB6|nr:Fur family transcriptional regulator [Clostridium sp. N3C]NLZ49248.1 transcriptional repressor [Clostridiales bacterium]SCN24795.1 Ferric uptake regulation protein [Clostridium sp. N3C]
MIDTELLKNNKLKVTFARKVILQILKEADTAVSADYIYEKCCERNYGINLSTVYRTLEVFEEKAIVEKFDLGDRKYSYSIKKDHHNHTIECNMCHRSIELECPIQMLEEIIKSKTGFTMMEHEIHIKGVCKSCQQKKEKII